MKLYTETDILLHQYCQTIAKANRTYVAKQEDDSHTNLYYDEIGEKIWGRWIGKAPSKYIFTYKLSDQQIEVLNESHQVVLNVGSIGKKIATIENEIAEQLPNLGLNPKGFTDALHYEIPKYAIKNEEIKQLDSNGLDQWRFYRKMGNSACQFLLGHLQISGEIRIWPHHFDTGIYVIPKEKFGLGFGLAMEDKMAGAPYFYMAAYPLKGKINYAQLPKSTHWQWKVDENWSGVMLTLTELEKYSEEEQTTILKDYILQNAQWYLSNKD